MNKRIVCWVGDAPNHRALVAKMATAYHVAGVVVDKKKKLTLPGGFTAIWKKIIDKLRFGKIDAAWSQLQEYYNQQFPEWPQVPLLFTDSINSSDVVGFTSQLNPDLVVVSGTSLIKEPLVSLPLPLGIMNLHTGLSPYVKGGPNCTNWCIANNEWRLIGNTIMWLSAGIDSGNIIASEKTELGAVEGLAAIHLKVMEHAHDLYLRAVSYILHTNTPHRSVPQASLDKGNLYLTSMWTTEKKRQLLRNLKNKRKIETVTEVKTVALP